LEAVGYDQSIKGPYLDMLFELKKRLRHEDNVFVIGFSFRDSIIASIFDEVVREKVEQGRGENMKVLLIDSGPQAVIENLKRQGYKNIANAITQDEVSFPNVMEYKSARQEIIQNTQSMLTSVMGKMYDAKISYNQTEIDRRLEKLGLKI
jgi:formate dehydrogenase assembly factor FdhD